MTLTNALLLHIPGMNDESVASYRKLQHCHEQEVPSILARHDSHVRAGLLMAATMENNSETAKKILAYDRSLPHSAGFLGSGMKTPIASENKWKAIEHAIASGYTELVKMMVTHEVDVVKVHKTYWFNADNFEPALVNGASNNQHQSVNILLAASSELLANFNAEQASPLIRKAKGRALKQATLHENQQTIDVINAHDQTVTEHLRISPEDRAICQLITAVVHKDTEQFKQLFAAHILFAAHTEESLPYEDMKLLLLGAVKHPNSQIAQLIINHNETRAPENQFTLADLHEIHSGEHSAIHYNLWPGFALRDREDGDTVFIASSASPEAAAVAHVLNEKAKDIVDQHNLHHAMHDVSGEIHQQDINEVLLSGVHNNNRYTVRMVLLKAMVTNKADAEREEKKGRGERKYNCWWAFLESLTHPPKRLDQTATGRAFLIAAGNGNTEMVNDLFTYNCKVNLTSVGYVKQIYPIFASHDSGDFDHTQPSSRSYLPHIRTTLDFLCNYDEHTRLTKPKTLDEIYDSGSLKSSFDPFVIDSAMLDAAKKGGHAVIETITSNKLYGTRYGTEMSAKTLKTVLSARHEGNDYAKAMKRIAQLLVANNPGKNGHPGKYDWTVPFVAEKQPISHKRSAEQKTAESSSKRLRPAAAPITSSSSSSAQPRPSWTQSVTGEQQESSAVVSIVPQVNRVKDAWEKMTGIVSQTQSFTSQLHETASHERASISLAGNMR